MEDESKSRQAKYPEGLELEQLIAAPLVEAAKAQARLCMEDVETMRRSLAGAVPQDKKEKP